MRTTVLMWMAASAMVLTLSQPASADIGRVVVGGFEFYAIGQGDIGGACLNDPVPPVPPEGAVFQSCARVTPQAGENWVGITVKDSEGNPVYFTVQQDGNPGYAGGCGTIQWGEVVAQHAGGELVWAINGFGDIDVFPWAGPGINNVLDPGGAPCGGSSDTNIIQPGAEGTVTFTFHTTLV